MQIVQHLLSNKKKHFVLKNNIKKNYFNFMKYFKKLKKLFY